MSAYVLSFRLLDAVQHEVPSTKEEHRVLSEGGLAFAEIQIVEQAYDANVRNYVDYEVRRARFMMNHIVLDHGGDDIREEMRDLARHFDNLLNSGSSVLNLISRYLKSRSLGLADAYGGWDETRSLARSELPGFQAIEYLRNHSQHAGTSIFSITLENQRSDAASIDWKSVRGLIPFAHIDHLVPSERDRRLTGEKRDAYVESLRAFSDRKQPDQIDLSKLVRQHMVGVGRLIRSFRQLIAEREIAWREVQTHALEKLSGPGTPNVAHIAARRDGDVYVEVQPLARPTMETIDRLRRRNGSMEILLRTEVRL